jgi:hypothetical protein
MPALPSRQITGPRARRGSHAEFIAKIGIVLEEADESEFWLEFLVATSIVPEATVKSQVINRQSMR